MQYNARNNIVRSGRADVVTPWATETDLDGGFDGAVIYLDWNSTSQRLVLHRQRFRLTRAILTVIKHSFRGRVRCVSFCSSPCG